MHPETVGVDHTKAKAETRRASDAWRSRVGAGIRHARELRSLTQSSLALAIGVDVTTISTIERGEVAPKYSTLEAIADALDVSVDELVNRPRPQADPSRVEALAEEVPGLSDDLEATVAALEVILSELGARRSLRELIQAKRRPS